MTTVLYVNLYPTLGGSEKALLQLLAGVDRGRVKPLVLLPTAGPFLDALRAQQVETVVEPFPTPPLPALFHPRVAAQIFRASGRICALARARGVGLVHCGDLLALVLVLPLLRRGVGLVYQVNYLGGRLRRLALRALALLERKIVVAWSQHQRAAVCAAAPGLAAQTLVVHPGLSPEDVVGADGAAFRREIGVRPEAALVGMLARFDLWKGHAVFLKAARRLLDDGNAVSFVVVGSGLNASWLPHVGAYERQMRELARALGLEGVLTFVPHRDDVPAVLAALDVVVCPSLNEPFGMVVIEAMAAGRAIVASDSGGPVEILAHDRTGRLFATGDPAALAGEVQRLLDDPEARLRLGRAARSDVGARFHRDRYAAEIQGLYERLA